MANDTLEFEAVPSEPEMEFEFVPVPSKTSRRLTPSTTSTNRVDLDLDLGGFEFTPTGEEILQTDDELYERIESDMIYKPTDAELDKFLDYKAKKPQYALDLIKGFWNSGKAVVGDLAGGVWGAVKDPELMFSPTSEGMLKRGFTLAEGAARASWDLGTVGRYINDWFSEQGDREYREEIEDMKLRQSNPDWKMDGAMGAEGYLSKEQKEEMQKSWETSYIKERIKEDLQHLEETTSNFKDPEKDLKRDFNRSGLEFVNGETRDFYTSPEYINNVLSPKQRDKYYEEFPKWINKRRRDRWRRGRYLMRTTELARRGETTVLGELFGEKVDEAAKAFVNSDVATLASYMGGPAEAGAALSTKFARKSATSPSALAGKATEKAGKATQWAGGKVKQFGEWATTSPEKSAAVGAALGVASGDDSLTVLGGALGGLAEQRVKVVPTAGEMLQKAGTAVEAVGEVIAKPEGVEGLLKAASRVAKDEGVAKSLNYLSRLDPAINVASDVGKAAATGSAFGAALTAPSGDLEVIGGGGGGGFFGGAAAGGATRFLTKGPRLKEQLQNEWSEFQKQLTPEQIKNVKEYAPTLEEMGKVITLTRMVNGTTRGGGNFDYEYLTPSQFAKTHNTDPRMRGVEIVEGKTRPLVSINIGYRGVDSLSHELWHAMKRFSGETEIKKTPEGKQEVEVLRPYLDRIQTILFGKRLNGKTVEEGMFSPEELISDRYDQYTSQMSPEARKAYDRQFEYDAAGNKLDPEVGRQKKLNKMMEEIEAESFRYLMSHATPQQIAQGNRSYKQRFIDHMLLSEHSKTLRLMRGALESVGIKFKPTGEPSDIFASKGQGITNSPELNAAFRQYLGAWEGMQYRTRMMGELEPSGFSVGGTGKAGRAQVEYALNKKENDFLRDHFSSSDILQKKDNGEVYYDPDGRVVLLTEGEIKKLQENRSELIREALSETDDGTGMVLMENGAFKGIPTTTQLAALDRIPNKTLTPNQKQIIRDVSDMMRNDPGAPIQFLYNAAIGGGKRYSSSLSSTHRTAVPLGFHVSKAQNFYFTALDLGAYHKKILAWGDPTKKALHKGGNKLELWDKDVRAFEADLIKYLENHKNDRKGAEGLDPDAQVAEMKRNVLNDFFDINRNKEEHGNFNPVTAARRAIDPKTGKPKKRAYRGLESLIRSYRLDRVLDENFGKSFSYALGKAIPMKSGAAFHESIRKNLMPAPSEGAFNKAKETFGTTKDPLEAGYVLPDGEMLDFSGRHEGSPERDIRGQRYSDHREISQIGTEMTPFVDLGAIRIDARSGLIELGKEPTASQLSVIKRIVEDRGSEVHFDLRDSSRPDYQPDRPIGQSLQPEPGTDPKRVIGMIRRFYRGDDISGAAGRFMPAPTFYSKAERAVEASQQKTMSVDQAVSLATKGIPKAEYEWSGVVDWLEGRKEEGEGKVSKAELMEFLQNKGVKVEEVARRSSEGLVQLEKVDADEVPKEYKNIYKVYRSDDPEGEHYGSEGEIIELADAESVRTGEIFTINMPNDPKSFVYRFHTLDSAKKYIKSTTPYASETLFKPGESDFVMLPGDEKAQQSYGELVLTLPEDRAKTHETFELPGSHRFPESNILAHIRFTERVDADGKKMLFIEELQSDWSNTGRRDGWRKPPVAKLPSGYEVGQRKRAVSEGKHRANLDKQYREAIDGLNKLYDDLSPEDQRRVEALDDNFHAWVSPGNKEVGGDPVGFMKWANEKIPGSFSDESVSPRSVKEWFIFEEGDKRKVLGKGRTEAEAKKTALDNLNRKYAEAGAPDMPFKGDNRYGALAMKRMIRWASDNGFDRLGWITGKDTAERYNLSKHIDRVELVDLPRGEGEVDSNDLFNLVAYDKEGGRVLYETVDESGVEGHLGKGMAKKLLESDRLDFKSPGGSVIPKSKRELSGVDLDISPQWPINLYDKVLPTQAKKIVKKRGAVGRTRLGGEKPLPQNVKGMTDSLENYIIEIKGHLNKPDSFWAERAKEPPRDLLTKEDWIQELATKEGELAQIRKDNPAQSYEANYVDITPEVKALAEEGFSYFMPPGGGKGRAAAPAQPVTSLPATPIMPKVKLTDEEKEDSRRLLNLLEKKGI